MHGWMLPLYVCTSRCMSVWVCVLPLSYSDGQQTIVCDTVLSILGSASLLIYHSCIVPELSTRLYLWCTNMPPLHKSHCGQARSEGFVTGGEPLQTGDQPRNGEDERRNRFQNLCIQWLGYSRQQCQQFPQSVAEHQGGAVGEIFWCILYKRVSKCVCTYTCPWHTLITLIISSNYLQTANEFLRNPIMLRVCSHHHPFCTAAINLLINKYN